MNVEYVFISLYGVEKLLGKEKVKNIVYTKKKNMAKIKVKYFEIEGLEQLDVGKGRVNDTSRISDVVQAASLKE